MSVLESVSTVDPERGTNGDSARASLGTAAARNLATTMKSAPQMQGISSRWLLRMLPWVQVSGGTYRVNRRLSYAIGDGRVTFTSTGAEIQVVPQELRELPLLRGFDDPDALAALAGRFTQHEYAAGDVITQAGQPADHVYLIAHGKINKVGTGKYGDETVLGVLADGEYFGEHGLTGQPGTWEFSAKAVTPCIALALPSQSIRELNGHSEPLRSHIQRALEHPRPARSAGSAPSAASTRPPPTSTACRPGLARRTHLPVRQDSDHAGPDHVLVMRTGVEDQGVIGLHKTGIPDENRPSLSVRFMGINEQAIISYLVSAYFSAAVLVPDALGVLENVELGRSDG